MTLIDRDAAVEALEKLARPDRGVVDTGDIHANGAVERAIAVIHALPAVEPVQTITEVGYEMARAELVTNIAYWCDKINGNRDDGERFASAIVNAAVEGSK